MIDKEFNQMKAMKKLMDFMREESIISPRQCTMLKNKIRNWWYIKTNQIKGYRANRDALGKVGVK